MMLEVLCDNTWAIFIPTLVMLVLTVTVARGTLLRWLRIVGLVMALLSLFLAVACPLISAPP